MSLLDDPALGLRAPAACVSTVALVRFRPASTFARDFGLQPGTEGVVTARYE